jgi:four helix bundle protein
MRGDDDLRNRTKRFALRIIRLVEALPRSPAARTIGGQLIRSGTSVASNYRAACRGRSKAEFISKLGIVLEEADESLLWLELLVDARVVKAAKLQSLIQEANELVAIMAASVNTAKRRQECRVVCTRGNRVARCPLRRRASPFFNLQSNLPSPLRV